MSTTRREFVKNAAMTGLGLGLLPNTFANNTFNIISPSHQLKVGLIGCKGMGYSNLQRHLKIPGVECIALCDIDQNVLNERAGQVEKLQGKKPALYGDYRKLLENKDIDYVIVGTPDHWHCLNMVGALESGKHVYVEKPIANTIQEATIMKNAAKKYGKIVQVGQWQRSGPHYEDAIKVVKSGELGKIRLVKVWAYQGWMKPVPVLPDTEVPKGVDYDMWLGPAPKRPFNANRFHFNFRWYWDYAGGLMTDWGSSRNRYCSLCHGCKSPYLSRCIWWKVCISRRRL